MTIVTRSRIQGVAWILTPCVPASAAEIVGAAEQVNLASDAATSDDSRVFVAIVDP